MKKKEYTEILFSHHQGSPTMEYYSVPKRNELSSYEKIWQDLKCISLNERNHCEKAAYCMVPAV